MSGVLESKNSLSDATWTTVGTANPTTVTIGTCNEAATRRFSWEIRLGSVFQGWQSGWPVGVGEGEELLPDYLNHLDQPASVAGLARPIIRNLDQFPYPDRTTLPIDYIESLPLDVPAVNGKWRFRSPELQMGC